MFKVRLFAKHVTLYSSLQFAAGGGPKLNNHNIVLLSKANFNRLRYKFYLVHPFPLVAPLMSYHLGPHYVDPSDMTLTEQYVILQQIAKKNIELLVLQTIAL